VNPWAKNVTGLLAVDKRKSMQTCFIGVLLTLAFGMPGSGRSSQATRELLEQARDLDCVQDRWHSFPSTWCGSVIWNSDREMSLSKGDAPLDCCWQPSRPDWKLTISSNGVNTLWRTRHCTVYFPFMKRKKVSPDQNQKPARALRPMAAVDLNQNEIDFVPSLDEVARRAYFRYACTRKFIPQLTPCLAFLLVRHGTLSLPVEQT
jgi:hypothetical protein